MILAKTEHSRDELPEALRDDALPACISFDEGNDISVFAVCVFGRSNVSAARQWMSSFFIPGVLPMIIDRASRREGVGARGKCRANYAALAKNLVFSAMGFAQ